MPAALTVRPKRIFNFMSVLIIGHHPAQPGWLFDARLSVRQANLKSPWCHSGNSHTHYIISPSTPLFHQVQHARSHGELRRPCNWSSWSQI